MSMTRSFALKLLLFVGTIIFLLFSVWLFPYLFPPQTFVPGASYEVGFNNGISYMCYIFLLGPAGIILARIIPNGSIGTTSLDRISISLLPTPVAWGIIIFHALLYAAIYVYRGEFVFADAVYFQTLIYRMAQGEVPYVDFSFYYGPAMLYPGYFLASWMPIQAAYGLYFVATYLVGLYLLYLIVKAIGGTSRHTNLLYVLISIGYFSPLVTLNVTFFRYLLPLVTFATVSAFFERGTPKTLVLAIFLLAFSMLYSFEVCLVSLLGVCLLVVLLRLKRTGLVRFLRARILCVDAAGDGASGANGEDVLVKRGGIVVLSAVAIFIGIFYLIDPSWRALGIYPEVALSHSAGAHNAPLYPNFPFLTLIALSVLAVALFLKSISCFEYKAEIAVAFVLCLVMERAAFGNAEPTHIAYFGLPIFLFCLALLQRFTFYWQFAKWVFFLLLVGIALPLQYYNATLFSPFIVKHFGEASKPAPVVASMTDRESVEQTLLAMVEQIGTKNPYLMLGLDYYSFPIYRKFGLKYATYFTFLAEPLNYKDINLVIGQLDSSNAVILAMRDELYGSKCCPGAMQKETLLDLLSGAHTTGSKLEGLIQSSRARLYAPLISFILSSYEVGLERDGVVALFKKDLKSY